MFPPPPRNPNPNPNPTRPTTDPPIHYRSILRAARLQMSLAPVRAPDADSIEVEMQTFDPKAAEPYSQERQIQSSQSSSSPSPSPSSSPHTTMRHLSRGSKSNSPPPVSVMAGRGDDGSKSGGSAMRCICQTCERAAEEAEKAMLAHQLRGGKRWWGGGSGGGGVWRG